MPVSRPKRRPEAMVSMRGGEMQDERDNSNANLTAQPSSSTDKEDDESTEASIPHSSAVNSKYLETVMAEPIRPQQLLRAVVFRAEIPF